LPTQLARVSRHNQESLERCATRSCLSYSTSSNAGGVDRGAAGAERSPGWRVFRRAKFRSVLIRGDRQMDNRPASGISRRARRAVAWRPILMNMRRRASYCEIVRTDYRSPIFETCCACQRLLQTSMNHWACPILPEGPTTPLCESSAGSFAFLDVRYEKSENGRLWASCGVRARG
jgi:hypothetical protein